MADEPVQGVGETPVEAAPTAEAAAPVQDFAAEIAALKQQNEELQALYRASLSQPSVQRPVAEPKSPDEMSDEDLWAQAQQGNRQAFVMWQERIADRRVQQRMQQFQAQGAVVGQLNALYGKYPELRDQNHPLTQRAVAFKAVLMQMGEPNNAKTDLDAILRAVADSRDTLSRPVTGTPAARQSSVAGQMGASHAQPKHTEPQIQVTPQEHALAKRMGVKDPAGAKKRFLERQEKGVSSVSPLIASVVKDNV